MKGIDTPVLPSPVSADPDRRNEFPDVKGIDTSKEILVLIPWPRRNEFPDVKGIDTLLNNGEDLPRRW